MSFKPMFQFGPDETQGNAQCFATYDEAYKSAADRFSRWTMPSGYFVEESRDPVNYKWDNVEGDVRIEEKS